MSECQVCRGSEKITLPLYRPMVAAKPEIDGGPMIAHSKTFPCPECVPALSRDNIAVVSVTTTVADVIADAHADQIRGVMASQIGAELMRRGVILFERGPSDGLGTSQMRVTLGVVTAEPVKDLQQRIAERQEDVARAMIEEANRRIAVWGRDYGDRNVPKAVAARDMREALAFVIEQRRGRRL